MVARLLREEGREVDVLAVADLGEAQGDVAANLERLPGEGPREFSAEALEGSGAVVDAMLGTGFEGSPREPIAGAIEAINAQDAPVIACDAPSGVNASTGEIEGDAVRATATGTFHGAKLGLRVNPGATHAGDVQVIEIGIPRGAPSGEHAGLISDRVLDLYPRRGREGSKFGSGVVVVVGGSEGLTGAPTMAALSAQRAGGGYVQVAVPAPAQQAIDLRLLEAMSRGLPDRDGGHTPEGAETVEEMAERAGAVVLGPGLGRSGGRGGVRSGGRSARAGAAADRRRRPQRPRRRAGLAARTRGTDRAHAPRGRAGTAAGARPRGGRRPSAFQRARGGRGERRRGAAQGRRHAWSPCPAARWP